jgi:hypothetical protein
VADVGGDSGSATDVIQAQGSNERISFEQERERLADSSTRAKDGDLGVTGGGRRKPTTVGRKAARGVSGKHFSSFRKVEEEDKGWWTRTERVQPRFVPSPAFPRLIIPNGLCR